MASLGEILDGTVQEVKEEVERKEGLDYQKLLEKEKEGQDRESLEHYLRNRVKQRETENNLQEPDDTGKQEEDAGDGDQREEKSGEVDYDELAQKTVKEVKSTVQESDTDLLKVLEKEKENQDRQVLVNWLENRIKEDEEEEEIESSFEELESKMKNVITDLKEENPEDKIEEINQGVKENVSRNGRTTKPAEASTEQEQDLVEKKDSEKRERNVEELEEKKGELKPTEKAAMKNHNVESKEEYEEFEQRIHEHGENFGEIRDMIGEVIVGQEDAVERVLIALMCDGNVLLEGVPGLGKSLLVETLQRTVSNTGSNRIQFVPDMLPSDILGQRIYNQKKGDFYINKGPVFTNFLLADEINRAPPKTQAAMMEVMQEKKVSIEDEEFDLEPPYLVMATQNPLEQKGTYPLPEAVIDRFFMKLVLDYPEPDEEVEILQRNSIKDIDPFSDVEEVVTKEDIIQVQKDVRNIYISPEVQKFIVEIVTTARGRKENGVEAMKYVDFGPSPRASIWLSLGASAYAILAGRTYVIPDDVKKIAKPILRHRILLNYEGKISDTSTDDVVEEILENVDTV
jgi:MoxR-like ATPase